MCSKEEVQKIVDKAELRLEKRIDEKLFKQQVELSKTVSNLMGEIKQDLGQLKEHSSKVDDIVSLYDGVSTVKSFVVGLASLIIAISAIGASIIWVIKSVR